MQTRLYRCWWDSAIALLVNSKTCARFLDLVQKCTMFSFQTFIVFFQVAVVIVLFGSPRDFLPVCPHTFHFFDTASQILTVELHAWTGLSPSSLVEACCFMTTLSWRSVFRCTFQWDWRFLLSFSELSCSFHELSLCVNDTEKCSCWLFLHTPLVNCGVHKESQLS